MCLALFDNDHQYFALKVVRGRGERNNERIRPCKMRDSDFSVSDLPATFIINYSIMTSNHRLCIIHFI